MYLVEFADWNSQAKIGYGCGNGSSVENTAAADDIPYHTGTPYTSRTTYGIGVQYRWIKSLWDNVITWIDGAIVNNKQYTAQKNPAKILADDYADAVNIGAFTSNWSNPQLMGEVTSWTSPNNVGYEGYMLPKTATTSEGAIYSCDYIGISNNMSFMTGGAYSRDQRIGISYIIAQYASSVEYKNIGSRLMVLPPSRLSA